MLTRLDEIERLNPDTSTGQELEAAELMNSFAKNSDGLGVLVERYAASTSAIVAQSLAYLLAVRAQEASAEMAHLVLNFIGRFRCWNHDEAVLNSLAAVQHCLHYVDAGEDLKQLSPFLRTCLEYSGRLWVIIRGHTLAMLQIAHRRELIGRIFTSEELVDLRKKIVELGKTSGEELRQELLDVQDLMDG